MKENVLAKILAGIILSLLSLGIGLAKGDGESCGCFIKMNSSVIDYAEIEEQSFRYYPKSRKMILECDIDICV